MFLRPQFFFLATIKTGLAYTCLSVIPVYLKPDLELRIAHFCQGQVFWIKRNRNLVKTWKLQF